MPRAPHVLTLLLALGAGCGAPRFNTEEFACGSGGSCDGSAEVDGGDAEAGALTDAAVLPADARASVPDAGGADDAAGVPDSGASADASAPDGGQPPTPSGILVSMTWDRNFTDLDVHLVRPGGAVFAMDGADCYYADRAPDWGVTGDAADDPSLELDDVDGFGPEVLRYHRPPAGDYELYVHYFADRSLGMSTASVDLRLLGRRITVPTAALQCNDLWHVGTIVWSGSCSTSAPRRTPRSQRNGVATRRRGESGPCTPMTDRGPGGDGLERSPASSQLAPCWTCWRPSKSTSPNTKRRWTRSPSESPATPFASTTPHTSRAVSKSGRARWSRSTETAANSG